MVRKLSLAVALALGVTPFAANALGLGDIESKSALNQQFNANIKLLSLKDEEIEDIRASIASADVFERAGIERPHFLTRLKFKPVLMSDGTGLIQVTSNDPIREPFLNFVVEVNWPKGRLFREYTVLLDPPATISRAPAPVQPARITAQPQPRNRAVSSPSANTVTNRTQSGTAGEYGPIRRNETLWAIAKQLRPRGATIEQTLMALFRANPQAFINNNVNNLKVGEVLRVPELDSILSQTPRQARVAFRDQLESWRQPQPVAEEVVAEESAGPATQIQPPGEEAAEPEVAVPEAELKIAGVQTQEGTSEAIAEGETGTASETDQLKQDLMVAREIRESALTEGQELKTRIQSLESQLNDLQRLLELKDEQLARLQQTLGTDSIPQAEVPAEPVGVEEVAKTESQLDPVITADSTVPEEISVAAEGVGEELASADESVSPLEAPPVFLDTENEEAPAETEPTIEPVEAATEVEELEIDVAAIDDAAAIDTEEASVEEIELASTEQLEASSETAPDTESVETPAPVATTVQNAQEPKPEPMVAVSEKPGSETGPMALLKKLSGDTTLMGVAAGSVLFIIGLIWLLVRRRKSSNEEFQESILVDTLQESEESELSAGADIEKSAAVSTDETSFLSDFSPSDIDVLQDETGEVDPLSEADVYIAYGRYGQAEELIRQAVERDPQRVELKRKLFEILYATKNKAGFTSLAEEAVLAKMPQNDATGWKAVVAMGAELLPDHKLFAQGAADSGGNTDKSLEEDFGDLADLDLGEVTDDLEIDRDLQQSLEDGSEIELSDLGLDEPALDETGLDLSDVGGSELQIEGGAAVDSFDLGDPGANLEREKESQLKTHAVQEDEAEAYSLDDIMNSETDDTVIDFSSAQSQGAELKMADEERLELPDMDDLGAGTTADFSDQPAYSADEVNTKLDLAKAYVEMGDAEGARGILDEVLSEGSERQKQTAQQMLEDIA